MHPAELRASDFSLYPPEAKAMATRELELLRGLPLAFLPLLLREVIDYDWKFPAERAELNHQFEYLRAKTKAEMAALMQPFAALGMAPELARRDWVNDPAQFSEMLSAHLWATHQMEAFRKASVDYVHSLASTRPEPTPAAPRVSLILIGKGVSVTKYSLFRKLRPFGVTFSNVAPDSGYAAAVDFVSDRARRYPGSFAHWYVDGAQTDAQLPGTSVVTYASLQTARVNLIHKMIPAMAPGGGGPERLRTELAHMRPGDIGLPESGEDALLSRFKLALLTQGSGTQMFSTTFVQWTAREVLRRAQPVTLLARFTPRQKEATVRAPDEAGLPADAEASLVDADMGAYYTWINQQRLDGAPQSRFFVWFEGHRQAFVAGPSFEPGATNDQLTGIRDLLQRLA